jgi:hypothetical protein
MTDETREPERFTLAMFRRAVEACKRKGAGAPSGPILSRARYAKCIRGEHEALLGVCVYCWSSVSPSEPPHV